MNEIEVIAEIGVNHDGDIKLAGELVYAAMRAGANTVKFQLWKTERVYPRQRWDEMKRLELPREWIVHLKDQATTLGLRFLCTPDTFDDAVFLKQIGCERLKIGSSNLTNKRMLRGIAELGLPVILSTGASEWNEVSSASTILGSVPLTIMHCVSAYPAPAAQMNMLVLGQYKRCFGRAKGLRRDFGFSDHTLANAQAALIALGMGARIFEKHITYDKNANGPDHAMSLDLVQFSTYVRDLKIGAMMLGSGLKQLMPCEIDNRIEYDRFVRQQMEGSPCTPS